MVDLLAIFKRTAATATATTDIGTLGNVYLEEDNLQLRPRVARVQCILLKRSSA